MDQDKVKQLKQHEAADPPTGDCFRQGALAAWPICLGFVPIGLALGVLAQQAGLPAWAMAMMSVLVFAGSSQFICVAMLAAGAAAPSIILATLMVNLRHALMSSALAVVAAIQVRLGSWLTASALHRLQEPPRKRAMLTAKLSSVTP